MVDFEFVEPWIQRADSDISSACFLAKEMHPIPTEIVCFHCQQAAEKYLKAFLVYNDQEPPKTHDLVELVRFCNNFDKDFLLLIPKCEYLLPFAIQTRYPSKIEFRDEDIKTAITYAQAIIEFVKSRI
jgi:HEPN domain-containing protein